MPTTGVAAYDPNKVLNSLPTVDDSMANQVTALASKDSALNRMAATEGLKMANRRGLLNSSMAIDASQDAVLKNILPIAGQDAQTAAAKNAAARAFEYGLTGQMQGQRWQTGERESGQKFITSERLGSQAYGTSERLGTQSFQHGERLGAQSWQTGERLGAEKFSGTQASLDRALETALQAGRITSAEKVAFAQIASTEGINAANNALHWKEFSNNLNYLVNEGKLTRAQALTIQNDSQAFEDSQNKALNALNLSIAKMNLSGTQQAGLMQAVGLASAAYSENYRTIMSNPDLDAATRTQQLGSIKKYFDDYIKAAQTIYNTNISWGK